MSDRDEITTATGWVPADVEDLDAAVGEALEDMHSEIDQAFPKAWPKDERQVTVDKFPDGIIATSDGDAEPGAFITIKFAGHKPQVT